MFYECTDLVSIDMSETNISQPTKFDRTFDSCKSLREVKFPKNWDTSKATTMMQMFSGCQLLESIDFSNFDTSSMTNLSNVFYGCRGLKRLDLSSFNTRNVTTYSSMFNGCYYLEYLDISNFDTDKTPNCNNMFSGCANLKYIDMRSFTLNKITSFSTMFGSVPTTCEIIVKGNDEKQWMATNFPNMTKVKTVVELEDQSL